LSAAADWDGKIFYWDETLGDECTIHEGIADPMTAIVLCATEGCACIGDAGGAIHLLDLAKGNLDRTRNLHSNEVTAIDVSKRDGFGVSALLAEL
jgi:WD40 repeat protein